MGAWRCWRWISHLTVEESEECEFHVPRRNQGQIVTVSYAERGDLVYCHVHDASDNSDEYFVRDWKISDGDCDFWNEAPKPTRVCGTKRYY